MARSMIFFKKWGGKFSIFSIFLKKKELRKIKASFFQQISFTFLYQS
jgi:hypothetical protein